MSDRAIADKKFKCNDDEAGVARHQVARLCELTLCDNLVRPLRRDSSHDSNGNAEIKKEGGAGRSQRLVNVRCYSNSGRRGERVKCESGADGVSKYYL